MFRFSVPVLTFSFDVLSSMPKGFIAALLQQTMVGLAAINIKLASAERMLLKISEKIPAFKPDI